MGGGAHGEEERGAWRLVLHGRRAEGAVLPRLRGAAERPKRRNKIHSSYATLNEKLRALDGIVPHITAETTASAPQTKRARLTAPPKGLEEWLLRLQSDLPQRAAADKLLDDALLREVSGSDDEDGDDTVALLLLRTPLVDVAAYFLRLHLRVQRATHGDEDEEDEEDADGAEETTAVEEGGETAAGGNNLNMLAGAAAAAAATAAAAVREVEALRKAAQRIFLRGRLANLVQHAMLAAVTVEGKLTVLEAAGNSVGGRGGKQRGTVAPKAQALARMVLAVLAPRRHAVPSSADALFGVQGSIASSPVNHASSIKVDAPSGVTPQGLTDFKGTPDLSGAGTGYDSVPEAEREELEVTAAKTGRAAPPDRDVATAPAAAAAAADGTPAAAAAAAAADGTPTAAAYTLHGTCLRPIKKQ